jgi:uncharacterized protein (TIGR03000 family)
MIRGVALAGIALLAVLLLIVPEVSGQDARGYRSGSLPWNAPGYRGYNEPTQPSQPPPPVVTAAPQKYTITVTILPQRVQGEDANIAVLMAHLPEDALIWFGDYATKSKGMLRTFESPPLTPGQHYSYRARIVWHEDGKWVSKTETIPVQAGLIHCIYLTQADEKSKIAANLAKLSPEDRKLAEVQKFCVEEDNPLGGMGVPVKIILKGQPVFLCCEGCVEKVQQEPNKTLAKVKELKAKNARTPPK